MQATVTEKGQVTVPKAIRDGYGIHTGSKLDFEPLPDGSLRLRVLAKGSKGLFGLLHKSGRRAKTLAEIDSDIAAAAGARNRAGR